MRQIMDELLQQLKQSLEQAEQIPIANPWQQCKRDLLIRCLNGAICQLMLLMTEVSSDLRL